MPESRFKGEATATIKLRYNDTDHEIVFSRLDQIEFDSELGELLDVGTFRQVHSEGTTSLKLTGEVQSKTAVPKHIHKWKPDGFGVVAHEGGIAHEGLLCECGARACGNVYGENRDSGQPTSIVHNIRETLENPKPSLYIGQKPC